jgi:hypothetical protein
VTLRCARNGSVGTNAHRREPDASGRTEFWLSSLHGGSDASCGTIRLALLKIGALVRVSVRRIKIAMASGCPTAAVWDAAAVRLKAAASARGAPA